MKRVLALAIVLVLSATAGWSQGAAGATKAALKPIASLGWLVGGVWTADASKLGPGMQKIETRYRWSDNDAYIRFNTHFVMDKGTARTYDGDFFWNPEQSTLSLWYMDSRNAITQGPVTSSGETILITFRGEDFEGKQANLRVQVVRKTNDRYTWVLEERQADAWKQLASLDYVRLADS